MSLKSCIYLSFKGQCEAAFTFYERHLGGTVGNMFRYGGSPMAGDVPPGWDAKIMHGSIAISGLMVLGADQPPERYERPTGFQVFLETTDTAEAERVFAALAENGTVHMPIQQTFWALRFGVVTDQFGIPWSINCEQTAEAPA